MDFVEKVTPIPWKEMKEEWTFLSGVNYFSSMAYDPLGYIWLSNSSGVYRLDLESGEYDSFGKPEVVNFGVDAITLIRGELWTVPATDHVAHLANGEWSVQEVSAGYFQKFENTGDRLWYMGSEKILYLEEYEWQVFEFPEEYSDHYYGVAKAGDGSLWFQAYNSVLQYDGAQWIEHTNLQGVSKMMTLASGEVIFIYDSVILKYDGIEIRPLVLPGERYRYSIRNSLLTPDGELWLQVNISSETDLTYVYSNADIEETAPVIFTDAPDPNIYTPMLMTPRGWVFFAKNIVYLFDGRVWDEFPLDKRGIVDTSKLVTPIGFSPDGKLWFTDGFRPVNYDGENIEDPFEEKSCERYGELGNITRDGKGVWLASLYNNTFCYFDLETQQKTEGNLSFMANGMDVAPDGSIWVSAEAGFIARVTPFLLAKNDYRLIEPIKIGGDDISSILIPSRILVDDFGAVWVYVKGYGVYRYKNNEWKSFGMPGVDVTAMDVDSDGNVWVGKPGKLLKHENGKWIEYPQGCICPTNLTIGPDDVIWFVNGCNGVYTYKLGAWAQFTAADLGGFTPSKILFAPDGATWFFNYNQWTRYRPEE
jgi:streptogramin lyase